MSHGATRQLGIAFVGTGFVADYYMTTLPNHPELRLTGVFDRDPGASARFSRFYGVRVYRDLDEILDDPAVEIVVNLTTPESHFEVSERALQRGKHVYCEKPLAMDLGDAETLVALAQSHKLVLATAPANALSPATLAVASALDSGKIGTPRLIYAELEDGPVFRDNWQEWRSVSGAPWPGPHEFEIGCTLEHAGYALSWLISLFGPVCSVTAFSALAFEDKGPPPRPLGPDFSVGALWFESGPVARLTCGLSAPRDRSLTIMGDKGTIAVRDLWDHHSSVRLSPADAPRNLLEKVAGRFERYIGRSLPSRPAPGHAIPVSRAKGIKLPSYPSQIDFCGGIAAQARAIIDGTTPFFSGEVALHITEIALALSGAGAESGPIRPRSTFNLARARSESVRSP
ncbi:MAG: Gfo/Idh/MocA family oxidoreductase [Rhizobiaceae bacterium]|nr:Gfo/Idh/MocA family oxidoreductase [Rhizobiaceae bacterium]